MDSFHKLFSLDKKYKFLGIFGNPVVGTWPLSVPVPQGLIPGSGILRSHKPGSMASKKEKIQFKKITSIKKHK